MSAPNTDPKKDAKRHKGPLAGLTGVVIWALVLLVGLTIFVTMRANDPGDEQPVEAEQAGSTSAVEPGSAPETETGLPTLEDSGAAVEAE